MSQLVSGNAQEPEDDAHTSEALRAARDKAIRLGRRDDALQLAETLAKLSTRTKDDLLTFASVLASAGQAGQCDQYMKMAERISPLEVPQYKLWFETLLDRKSYRAAGMVLERLIHNNPTMADLIFYCIRGFERIDSHARARHVAVEALARDSISWSDEQVKLVLDYVRANVDHDLTMRASLLRLEYKSGHLLIGPQSILALAQLLMALHEYRATIDLLVAQDPSPDTQCVLGLASWELGVVEKAVVHFDQTTSDTRKVHGAELPFVLSLMGVGRLSEALSSLEDYQTDLLGNRGPFPRAEEPASEVDRLRWHVAAYLHVLRGSIFASRGDYTSSWTHFRKAVAFDHSTLPPAVRLLLLSLEASMAPPTKLSLVNRALDEVIVKSHSDEDWMAALEAKAVIRDRVSQSTGTELPDVISLKSRARELYSRRAHSLTNYDEISIRLAFMAGDYLVAREMMKRQYVGTSWQEDAMRSLISLRLGDAEAEIERLTAVMAQKRDVVDLRLLYCYAAFEAGNIELALREASAIVDEVPENVVGHLLLAECLFNTAISSRLRERRSKLEESAAQARVAETRVDSTNIQQLMDAIHHYCKALELHDTLASWFHGSVRPSGLSERARVRLGSQLLSDQLIENVCRRGMQAASLAAESSRESRIRLDAQLLRHLAYLTRHFRALRSTCCSADTKTRSTKVSRARSALHSLRHLAFSQDEPTRLSSLCWSPILRPWLGRLRLTVGFLIGLVVTYAALFPTRLPAPVALAMQDLPVALRSTIVAAGAVLILLPFVGQLKFAGFEIHRPDELPLPPRRSDLLGSNPIAQASYYAGLFSANALPRALQEPGGSPASEPGQERPAGARPQVGDKPTPFVRGVNHGELKSPPPVTD